MSSRIFLAFVGTERGTPRLVPIPGQLFDRFFHVMAKDGTNSKDRSEAEQDIDDNLRRAFDHIANEPLPDRFGDLLARLRAGNAPAPGDEDAEPNEGGDAR
jgi:hypothetical protein